MTIHQTLAKNVVAFRKKRGWTQDELASKIGVHHSVISSIENGRKNVGLRTLDKLAKVFKIKIYQLLE